MGVEGCGCGDDSVGKGSDGRNKGGGGSVCRDSVDEGDIGEDGGDKGGERCGGDGSWLGIGKVGSKDLRRADKGARFVAGTGGRHGDDSGGKGRTGFGKLRVSGGGTVARRS